MYRTPLLALCILVTSCEDVPPLGDDPSIVEDTVCIGPEGGRLSVQGGRVVVPEGAVASSLCLVVVSSDAGERPPIGVRVSRLVELSFDTESTFNHPLRLEIDYVGGPRATVYRMDRLVDSWVPLTSASLETDVGTIHHGDGFVSIETVSPGGYVLAVVEGQECTFETEYDVCGVAAFCNRTFACEPHRCGDGYQACPEGASCVAGACAQHCERHGECDLNEICYDSACQVVDCTDDATRCYGHDAVCAPVGGVEQWLALCIPEEDY